MKFELHSNNFRLGDEIGRIIKTHNLSRKNPLISDGMMPNRFVNALDV